MPKNKKFVRSKGKKRTFHENCYVKVNKLVDSQSSETEKVDETSTTTLLSEVASTSASEIRSLPASKRKLHSDVSSEDDEGLSDGFRLVDIYSDVDF